MTNSKIEFYWYKDRNMYIPFANNKLSVGTQELSAWMDDEIGNSLSSVELVINDFLVMHIAVFWEKMKLLLVVII